jgi:hypothetical protein
MTRGALLRRVGGGAGTALAAAALLSTPTMSIAKVATAARRSNTMAVVDFQPTMLHSKELQLTTTGRKTGLDSPTPRHNLRRLT